jgi:hypothetical protein
VKRRWRACPGERLELYSPVGLRPVDELTGGAPFGWIRAELDVEDGAGAWRRTDIAPAWSLGGVIIYPGLERHADPASRPSRRFRARIDAEFYVPLYRTSQDAIEFDVFAYNDAIEPGNYAQIRATQPQDVVLTALPSYRFPSHIRVLRGVVQDAAQAPVADVLVAEGARERVVTDSRGAFVLPLRWVAAGAQATIDATDQRTGRTGSITVNVPLDLSTSHTITIA